MGVTPLRVGGGSWDGAQEIQKAVVQFCATPAAVPVCGAAPAGAHRIAPTHCLPFHAHIPLPRTPHTTPPRSACPAPAAPLTPPQVALKRVADVLQSPEHTKRVLREICILRRLRHPSLISVRLRRRLAAQSTQTPPENGHSGWPCCHASSCLPACLNGGLSPGNSCSQVRDAWTRPSSTGQCRLINGRLVNLSVDVVSAAPAEALWRRLGIAAKRAA